MLGNIIGGILGMIGAGNANSSAEKIAAQNIALQREFATHGIRWKVEDARQAGVHPLYALGASTTSFSPVSVGYQNELAPLADMAKSMGQDLSRASQAGTTTLERTAAQLKIENMQLQNDILRTEVASKVARLGNGQVPPAMPQAIQNQLIPGQPSTDIVKVEPQEVTAVRPGQSQAMPAPVPGIQYVETAPGRFSQTIPQALGESYEADWMGSALWGLNNQILPRIGKNLQPPPWSAGPGKVWAYDTWLGEWEAVNPRSVETRSLLQRGIDYFRRR